MESSSGKLQKICFFYIILKIFSFSNRLQVFLNLNKVIFSALIGLAFKNKRGRKSKGGSYSYGGEDKIKNKLGQITPSFLPPPKSTISGVTLLITLMACLKSVSLHEKKNVNFGVQQKLTRFPTQKESEDSGFQPCLKGPSAKATGQTTQIVWGRKIKVSS